MELKGKMMAKEVSQKERDEQKWILRQLAQIIRKRGYEPFVTFPILEPKKKFFPDPWTPNGEGVWYVAQRFLRYAGLNKLKAVIDVVSAQDMPNANSAAFFMGIESDRCRFGVCRELLDDAEGLTAALAHETAHAYRSFYGMENADSQVEERLTDITTIYLGFGILTCNAAYRYRAHGEIQGTQVITSWSHSSLGYLSPEAMSFLLAVQSCVKEGKDFSPRSISKHLETNQASYFRTYLKGLRKRRESLFEELSIPRMSLWSPPIALAERTAQIVEKPLVEHDDTVFDTQREAAARQFNRGKPVFRVRVTKRTLFLTLASIVGLFLVMIISIKFAAPVVAILLFATLVVMAGWAGGALQHDKCSDPNCEAVLKETATTCPGCGGDISGRIKRSSDRLAAEEALLDGGEEAAYWDVGEKDMKDDDEIPPTANRTERTIVG